MRRDLEHPDSLKAISSGQRIVRESKTCLEQRLGGGSGLEYVSFTLRFPEMETLEYFVQTPVNKPAFRYGGKFHFLMA